MRLNNVEVLYMRWIWSVVTLLALFLAGCGPAFISGQNIDKYNWVVAQADTLYSLTMSELYEKLVHSELLKYGGTLEAERVQAFLDSVLCDTLAGFKADEIDLSQYYDLHRMYKKRYYRSLTARYFEEMAYKKVTVDSQEVLDFRSSHPELFALDEQVMLYQILVSPIGLQNGPDSSYYSSLTPEQLDQETAEYTWRIRRLLDFGEPFKDVARLYSHDIRTKMQGGLVGWTKRGVYLDPFDSVAFAMDSGEVSQPYQDETGWHILYVQDRIDEGVQPLDEEEYKAAEAALIMERARGIADSLRDSIYQQIQLVFNEKLLDTNVHLVQEETWAAIVNGLDTISFSEMGMPEEIYRKRLDVPNTTLEMKREMLHGLAVPYAIVQTACAIGIDTLPEIVTKERVLWHNYTKQIVYLDSRDQRWRPSDSLIEKYFNEHTDEFSVDEELRIQHIIVEDSMFGELLRDQVMAGVDFIELAKEYYPGEPSIRADLANLGEIGPEDVPEELYAVALVTPVGGVSHPVKTQYGYHIVKVLKHTRAVSVDQVRDKIAPILEKEHDLQVFNEFRDELYARFNVRFPGKIYPIHLKPLAVRSK
jgi:parvulin-like peptidyl-prolyl isomerase